MTSEPRILDCLGNRSLSVSLMFFGVKCSASYWKCAAAATQVEQMKSKEATVLCNTMLVKNRSDNEWMRKKVHLQTFASAMLYF